jgi:tRNA modification GTPase
MTLDQAEAVLDLVNARTERAADDALEGVKGQRGAVLRRLYAEAVAISAEIEHSLDVDESELPPGFVESLVGRVSSLRDEIIGEAKRERSRRIFREGATVVLLGPPNAGKSSLMNALLGEDRAIVSDAPGTTRDSIDAWMDVKGWPVRLVDTAGLRETGDAVEGEGVRRARELAGKADVVVVFDGAWQILPPADAETIRVHAKCDVSREEGALNVSAATGEGVGELVGEIGAALERRADSRASGDCGGRALSAFERAAELLSLPPLDPVPLANAVRDAAMHLGAAAGTVYGDDLLENLFSRFCVGK